MTSNGAQDPQTLIAGPLPGHERLRALFLSVSSVKRKPRAIFDKLDVHSRTEAVRRKE